MKYFFDYGFLKDQKWLDGIHQKEEYDDTETAMARYLEIVMNGQKAEKDLKEKGMLPEGNRFMCTVDVYHDNEWRIDIPLAFVKHAFDILNSKQNEMSD